MKKFTICLVLTLCMLLCACGKTNSEPTTLATEATTVPTTEATEATVPSEPQPLVEVDLDSIQYPTYDSLMELLQDNTRSYISWAGLSESIEGTVHIPLLMSADGNISVVFDNPSVHVLQSNETLFGYFLNWNDATNFIISDGNAKFVRAYYFGSEGFELLGEYVPDAPTASIPVPYMIFGTVINDIMFEVDTGNGTLWGMIHSANTGG